MASTSNVSREKLLFYAAAGALGGFAAWGLIMAILPVRALTQPTHQRRQRSRRE